MTPDQRRGLERAEGLLRGGRPREAQAILRELARQVPDAPIVWWALGNCGRMLDDIPGAETAFRELVRLDGGKPQGWMALGDLLASAGRVDEAETAWRGALKADPRSPAAGALAEHLAEGGRGAEALFILAPILAARRDPAVLACRARVHRAMGRLEEAAADLGAAAALAPGVPALDYELAVALASLNRGPETVAAGRRALAGGVRTPEVLQLIGHGERVQGRLAEAEATFREGLRQWPDHEGLHRELAYLVWAVTGDAAAATAAIDEALRRRPGETGLLVLKARLLEYAGDLDAAGQVLAGPAARPDASPLLLSTASRLALPADPAAAVDLARRALARTPDDPFGLAALAEAHLAAGDAAGADEAIERLLALAPDDEHGLSLRRIVWRLTGDPRYARAYDYDALVSTQRIETPPGWGSLDAYLADLARALRALHDGKAHPVGQSLRGGTQTNKTLAESDDPAIVAFFEAIDAPVRNHVAMLDAHEGRTTPTPHRVARSWSVRLRPGGNHVDHMHKAWISSAFYVALPAQVEAGGHAGWLRLGKPGIATQPPLEAERWVRPEPGLLALFPAYMWHGTEPFEGDEERLTIAFDIDRA